MDKSSNANDSCCKDEHKQIKVDDDHKLSENIYGSPFLTPIISVTEFSLPGNARLAPSKELPTGHAPPLYAASPIYIRIHVLRI